MPLIKLDRDFLLDKLYACRSKIDFTNVESLKEIDAMIDLVIHAPMLESQSTLPRLRIGR